PRYPAETAEVMADSRCGWYRCDRGVWSTDCSSTAQLPLARERTMMRGSFRQYAGLFVGTALLSAVAACAAPPRSASFHLPDEPLPSSSGPSASPSASASASASPAKSPAKGPAPAPAPRGGKPVAGNTGPVAGTALAVVNGNQTF